MAVPSGWRAIIILPHAHVSPDDAIACLAFEDKLPVSLSVLQLPCWWVPLPPLQLLLLYLHLVPPPLLLLLDDQVLLLLPLRLLTWWS